MTNCLNNLIKNNIIADTHCHLNEKIYEQKYAEVFNRALKNQIKELWMISVDFASALKNIEIIEKYQKIFPELKLRLSIGFDMELIVPGSDLFNMQWFGLSKSQIKNKINKLLPEISKLASEKNIKIDLIGEVGLDFYHLEKMFENSLNDSSENNTNISQSDIKHSKKLQKVLFETQIQYACENKLPLSIHSRGAENECIEIIKKYKSKYKFLNGIFHSFTGNPAQIKEILNFNFFIGINGIVTYKSATFLLQAIKRKLKLIDPNATREYALDPIEVSNFSRIPFIEKIKLLYLNGFVVETDSPFLIPANSNRKELEKIYGKNVNEPGTIVDTVNYIFF